jgi:hypothetical protein
MQPYLNRQSREARFSQCITIVQRAIVQRSWGIGVVEALSMAKKEQIFATHSKLGIDSCRLQVYTSRNPFIRCGIFGGL